MPKGINAFWEKLKYSIPESVPQGDYEFWNHNAPEIKLIRMEMERAGLGLWNNKRVVRLCRGYQCTIWTLCARAGAFNATYNGRTDRIVMELNTSLIRRCWTNNLWSPLLTVQFDRMEKYLAVRQNKPGATLISEIDRINLTRMPVNT